MTQALASCYRLAPVGAFCRAVPAPTSVAFPKGGPPFLNLPPLTLTALEAAILPLSGCADGALAVVQTGQIAVAFFVF